jgi:hypothetical protein
MALRAREPLGQVWRLGRRTYKWSSIEHAAECLICGYMTFEHDTRCSALTTLGKHLLKEHAVDVLFAISDQDGVITGPDGQPLEFEVDGFFS